MQKNFLIDHICGTDELHNQSAEQPVHKWTRKLTACSIRQLTKVNSQQVITQPSYQHKSNQSDYTKIYFGILW